MHRFADLVAPHSFSKRRNRRRAITATLVAMCALTAALKAQGFGIPIIVDNPTGVARQNEPVVSGLSVPLEAGLYDPALFLTVKDDIGVSVPAQFDVLARWGGTRDSFRPVKWVLVSFPATVAPNGQRTYYVSLGGGPMGQVTASDLASEVVVDTGVATFTLDKTAFSVFKSVTVNGVAITGAPGSLDVLDASGNAVACVLSSTQIETSGDVRCVVRQKGTMPALGLDFTVRYRFFTGRADVKVDFRLENNGAYGLLPQMGNSPSTAFFEALALTVRLPASAQSVATTESSHSLQGAAFDATQDWTTPSNPLQMTDGFQFAETLGGALVTTGQRHGGAISAAAGQTSIACAVDRFWQNFPKGLRCDQDALSIELFPAFGAGPHFSGQYGLLPAPNSNSPFVISTYRLDGGRWKTHTLYFDFSDQGAFSPADLDAFAARVAKPLMCRYQETERPFDAFAFGQPLVDRKAWVDTAATRYERILDTLCQDQAADFQPVLGRIGFPAFRDRGGTYGGWQFYGWENFGDIAWGDGYSSLHYDMPYGVLINWYRTGDYRFFDVGRDMAAHRRDYDQYHSQDPSDPYRGGQWYEKGYFHGNFTQPVASHLWVHGLLLYYVMTGDEGAREAALEVGEYVKRQHPEAWNGMWGARILGWQLEALMDLYNYVGDLSYLTVAEGTVQQWIVQEQANGGQGYVLNQGWAGNPHAQTWMHMIVMNALAKYYLATFDTTALGPIQRMALWLVSQCMASVPTGPATNRTVGKVYENWAPTWVSNASMHHTWALIEALANASICLHDDFYLLYSWSLFDATTRYYQSASDAPRDYTDPSTYSAIAFRMQGFPNSESKIMSNIARWGHAFLALRRYRTGF